MTTLTSPSFALRPQRDGLRQKHFSSARQRAGAAAFGAAGAANGFASDSVFKRMPAIGETPATPKQR